MWVCGWEVGRLPQGAAFLAVVGWVFWPVPLGNGRSRVLPRLTKVGWEDRYPIKDSRYWKDWLGQMQREWSYPKV